MLRRRALCGAVWLGALWASWSQPALAGLARPVELAELVAGSSDVVRGRVVELDSRWNAAHTLIETDIRLEVAEALKGEARGEIVLTLPGGQVGDLVLAVSEAPRLSEDEEVLIFLRRQPDGRFLVPYLVIGTYRVETDARGRWLASLGYSLANLMPDRASALDTRQRLSWDHLQLALDKAVRSAGGGR